MAKKAKPAKAKPNSKPAAKASAKAKVPAKVVKAAPKADTKVKTAKPSAKTSAVKAAPAKSAKPEASKLKGKAAAVAKPSKSAPEKAKSDKLKTEKNKIEAQEKPSKKTASKETARVSKSVDPVLNVRATPVVLEEPEPAEEVILTDAEGRRYCRIKDCDRLAEVEMYCRYHYISLWKNIQTRRQILQEGKLERYIEELTARYPDKFLEILKKDLRSEKDFLAAIAELEIDESAVEGEYDEEENQSDLYEVQRMSDAGAARPDSDEDRF